MTDVFASISVHSQPFRDPHEGSCVLLALSRSINMRTIDAAMVKAPRAKMAIRPALVRLWTCRVRIRGMGRR